MHDTGVQSEQESRASAAPAHASTALPTPALPAASLDRVFRQARTYHGWTDVPVTDDVVLALYDLLKWGPTSANSSPARFVWVTSTAGRAKLAESAWDRNKSAIRAAPLTVIIGDDLDFADALPQLSPHNADVMQKAFAAPGMAESTARRNGTLQGAYLIVAARALGLDCGPMSGFDNDAVDREFFAGTRIRSNFICSVGYGDPESLHPRGPRLGFDQAGRFA